MYAFFEFKIKVRLRRSALHGYQWCVRKKFNLKSNFTCNMCICEFTIVHVTQTGYTECHSETNLSVKCTSRS